MDKLVGIRIGYFQIRKIAKKKILIADHCKILFRNYLNFTVIVCTVSKECNDTVSCDFSLYFSFILQQVTECFLLIQNGLMSFVQSVTLRSVFMQTKEV